MSRRKIPPDTPSQHRINAVLEFARSYQCLILSHASRVDQIGQRLMETIKAIDEKEAKDRKKR